MKKTENILNIIDDNTLEIILTDRYNNEIARTLVDKDMYYNKLYKYIWCLDKSNGYAVSCIKNKKRYLHKLIIDDCGHGEMVDHINRNRLDNRCVNLRKCTKIENSRNTSVIKGKYECNIVGVMKRKDRKNRWEVYTSDGWVMFNNLEYAIEFRLITEVENGYNEFSANISLYQKYNISLNPLDNIHRKNELLELRCQKKSTDIKGVHLSNNPISKKKFVAVLYVNKQLLLWESFYTLDEAIRCRLEKEIDIYGYDKAPQKHLFEKYKITESGGNHGFTSF